MPAIQPVSYQTLVRIFERMVSPSPDRAATILIYTKPDVKRPLVIPAYRSVPVFIVRNLLRTSGMSRERYFDLLGQV